MTDRELKAGAGAPGTARRESHVKAPLRTLCRALISLSVVLACAVSAPSALASQPPHPAYIAQGATIPNDGTVSNPQGLAINQANHTLLVADQGNARVSVFSSSLAAEPSVGVGTLVSPYGIAVDQTLHRLYVSDAGTNTIVRYTFTTTDPATFTPDAGFVGPALGAGAGQIGSFASALAVDPTTHELLVADQGNHLVSRFSATGTFVRSFDGSSGADGAFVQPSSVAVGTDGTVYVADSRGLFDSTGNLERFTATGAALSDLTDLSVPKAVGVGAASGMVAVGSFNPVTLGSEVRLLAAGTPPPTQTLLGSVGSVELPTSVAVDDTAGGNLYIDATAFGSATSIYVLTADGVLAPGVTAGSSSAVTTSSAHVTGIVDAGDLAATATTSAHFEYYTTDASAPTQLPDLLLPAAGPNAVAVDLSGLRPNTTYHVRLVASRVDDPSPPAASSASPYISFTTGGSAPAVDEPPIRDVADTTATLSGTVDPFGIQGSYHFEYGTTDAYGSREPTGVDGVIGAPAGPVTVRAGLKGLTPNTTYHYRLVGVNAVGTTFGPDREFTTDPSPTLDTARSYEQITPVDKGGALMSTSIGFAVQADASAADGSRVAYSTQGSLPGAAIGTGVSTEYLATRGSSAWTNQLLEVPFTTLTTQPTKISSVATAHWLDQHPVDLSRSIVYSDHALTSGAVEGSANMYREDNATGALTLLGTLPPAALAQFSLGQERVFATPDSQHVWVLDNAELYAVGGGHVTLVSIMPNGDPVDAVEDPLSDDSTGANGIVKMAPISTPSGDAVVYASLFGSGAFINRGGQVTAISVSERPGDPSTPVAVGAAGFSGDGRSVFFVEAGSDPLTADGGSEPGAPIYRYTLDAPVGHHLTFVGGQGGTGNPIFKASADGQTVVYNSPDGLRVWRGDQPPGHQRTLLSAVYGSTTDTSSISPAPVMSPDGRYVALLKGESLTGEQITNNIACKTNAFFRDGRCAQIYLFDVVTGTAACVSCAVDGTQTGGDAALGEDATPALTNDGEIFFTTKTRLVSADVNADSDVYAYQSGRVHLISRGTTGTHAVFQGASSNGHDVFLLTDDHLVTQDTDNAIDLYDARVGGGLSGQNPSPDETAACAATECREPGGGPAATSGPGAPSESVLTASSANLPKATRARVSAAKVTVSATTVRLTVHPSSRGDLRISGRYLTTFRRSIAAPGAYTVRVRLSHAAQRQHKAHHRLRVGVRISLTPPFGPAAVATLTRTLRG
jgi:hypothetical protein